jgi:signal transduction histidine kinase
MRRWVPRPIDLAVAAVLTVATQVEIWLLAPDVPLAAVSASLAVGTAAVAWHRLAPLTALTVGITGLGVVPGALGVDPASAFGWFVAALWLMASAGYHARRPLVALAVSLVLWAASIILQKGFVPADILFAWLLAGPAWVAGRALAGRTARAELAEQRAVAAEQEAHWRTAAAVAEERLRIAREMHDVVSHSLSVITLHVSGVRRLLRPDQVAERAALETAEQVGRESLAEMHRLLGVLRGPETDAPAPGLARLPDLLEPARAAGVEARLEVRGEAGTLPPGPDLAAFRIVQEAVTNALRHAHARRLTVTVVHGDGRVELTVEDDGSGCPPSPGGGHGLIGMRERAAVYGGQVTAGPGPTGGWAVHAVLPVPADPSLLTSPTPDGVPA